MLRRQLGMIVLGILLCTGAHAIPPITSTFDSTLEGWTLGGDMSVLSWDGPGGDPGGYAWYRDTSSGAGFIRAPSGFLGDWTTFNEGSLSFSRKILDPGCLPHTLVGQNISISGPGGSAHYLVPPPQSSGVWEQIFIPIHAGCWTLDAGSWNGLLQNVTDFWIQIELVGNECGPPGDRDGIDNVSIREGHNICVIAVTEKSWGIVKNLYR